MAELLDVLPGEERWRTAIESVLAPVARTLLVDQDRINLFADATGDHQWIHVDEERAKGGPFGTTIAHGFLTLSLLPRLVQQVYRVDGVRMAVKYGLDRVRFIERTDEQGAAAQGRIR